MKDIKKAVKIIHNEIQVEEKAGYILISNIFGNDVSKVKEVMEKLGYPTSDHHYYNGRNSMTVSHIPDSNYH